MATLLVMPLMCCQTKPQSDAPIFPELQENDYVRNADGTVNISSAYLIRLAEFKLRYEEYTK